MAIVLNVKDLIKANPVGLNNLPGFIYYCSNDWSTAILMAFKVY